MHLDPNAYDRLQSLSLVERRADLLRLASDAGDSIDGAGDGRATHHAVSATRAAKARERPVETIPEW